MNSKMITPIMMSLATATAALAGGYTTASMDSGTGNSDTSWYEQGYNTASPTTGLPRAGSSFTHQNAPNHQYTMAPSYRSKNAVLLDSSLTGATLALATPAAYSKLSFLESGGHEGVTFRYTIRHQNGTTQTGSGNIPDWFNGPSPAWTANGRVNVGSLVFSDLNGGNPRLYGLDIKLSNSTNPVVSIVFNYVSGWGHGAIMAVSGSTGAEFTPIAVTGYNQDIVVEAGAAPARKWQDGLALSHSEGTNRMAYRLYLPYAYNPTTNYPLVLFLHGAGEGGTDNTKQVSVHIGGLIDRTYSNYPALLVAPQLPSGSWSPDNSSDLTLGILADVRRHYAVDERRLYVTGLSKGGFGTTEYAIHFPSVFAAIAPMSGARTYGYSWAGTRLASVPTWLFHGSRDTVVPNQYSRDYYTNVTGLSSITFTQTVNGYPTAVSGPIRYTELPNMDHVIWPLIYANTSTTFYDWMFSQTRPPATSALTGAALTNNAIVISASCDVPFASGYLVGTANLGAQPSQWQCLATNSFDATGSSTFTPATAANDACRFYRVRIP